MITNMKILFKIITIVFFFTINGYSQLQYKTGQFYLSPSVSIGAPAVINQNNYGFGEMAYGIKLGGQTGILFGYDNYLKSSFRFGVLYSRVGQVYSDVLLNVPHNKNITLDYLQVPVVFKYVLGDTKGFDFSILYKYIFGGLQLSYLLNADISWQRDNNEVDFLNFISFGAYEQDNRNLEEIREIGAPLNDVDFFSNIDVAFVGGAGLQYFISRRIMVFSELVGNIGIRDINSPTWRFRSNKREYVSSLNIFGGLRFGITFYP